MDEECLQDISRSDGGDRDGFESHAFQAFDNPVLFSLSVSSGAFTGRNDRETDSGLPSSIANGSGTQVDAADTPVSPSLGRQGHEINLQTTATAASGSSAPVATETTRHAAHRDAKGFAVPVGRPLPQDLAYVMQFAGESVGASGQASSASVERVATADDVETAGPAETEDDSEASSSDESTDSADDSDSDTDDESSGSEATAVRTTPMTAEQRAGFLAQLSTFGAGAGLPPDISGLDEDGNEVGYITESSDDDEGGSEMELILPSMQPGNEEDDEGEVEGLFDAGAVSSSESEGKKRLGVEVPSEKGSERTGEKQGKISRKAAGKKRATAQSGSDSEGGDSVIDTINIEEDDEDEGPVSTAPPLTKNEVAVEPVKIPPVSQLPKGERLVFAGEVMQVNLDQDVYDLEAIQETATTAELAPTVADNKLEAQAVNQEATTPAVSGSNESHVAAGQDNGKEEGEIEEPAIVISGPGPTQPSDPSEKGKDTPRRKAGKAKKAAAKQTAGSVIIRAARAEVGSAFGRLQRGDQDGWLEEDSLICFPDGRVVAHVAETFGPTSAPFYLVRLPPPPFPLPSAESLRTGTKLYYPVNRYRSFVPVQMLATDKRYKGTDASNLFDEEPGEEEIEYSDDEAEAQAKIARKKAKHNPNARAGSSAPSERSRHFNAPSTTAGSEAGDSEYLNYKDGAPAENDWENLSDDGGAPPRSEFGGVGSVASSNSAWARAAPMPYDDIYPSASDARAERGTGERGGRGTDRGRGRGRGQDRGRGRGDSRGGRGGRGGEMRGGRGGRGQSHDRPRGGGHPYSPTAGRDAPPRNFDGGRNIGRGAGRGRGSEAGTRGGRGAGQGAGQGNGQGSSHGGHQDVAFTIPIDSSLMRREDGNPPLKPMATRTPSEQPYVTQASAGVDVQQPGYNGGGMHPMGTPYMGMPMMMPGMAGGMGYGFGGHQPPQGQTFPPYGYGQQPQMHPHTMGMQMGQMGMQMGMHMGGMGPGPGHMGMCGGGYGQQAGMGAINPRFAAQFGVPPGGGAGHSSAGGNGQSGAGPRFEQVD